MRTEKVNGYRVRVYDAECAGDRYTVVYMDFGYPNDAAKPGCYCGLGMNEIPTHPSFGIGQHCECKPGRHLGKRIPFDALPEECKRVVWRDLTENVATA